MRTSAVLVVTALLVCQVCLASEWVHKTKMPNPMSPEDAAKLNFPMNQPPASAFPGKTHQPKGAGRADGVVNSQIVGGVVSNRSQFPWLVVVHADNAYLCGGSLVSNTWVLTAAHCVDGRTNFIVTLGAQQRSAFEDGRVALHTTSKFMHASYNSTTIQNDVAMIKLPIAVPMPNTYWNVIRLPKQSDTTKTYENIVGTASGWGKTSDAGSASDVQYNAQLTIISNTLCAQTYGAIIFNTSLCVNTNYTTGARSTCQGDSGGPLAFKDPADNLWTLIGVTSFGSGNGCQARQPSVFARVTHFLPWISTISGIAILP